MHGAQAMTRKQTVLLYGNSLTISSVAATLRAHTGLRLLQVTGGADAMQDRNAAPDVVIFDLVATPLEAVLPLAQGQAAPLLIGLDLASDRTLVVSGGRRSVHSQGDLLRLIGNGCGGRRRGDRKNGRHGDTTGSARYSGQAPGHLEPRKGEDDMKTLSRKLVAGLLVATALLTAGVALAANGDTVYACVNSNDGTLRLVQEGAACKKNETLQSWYSVAGVDALVNAVKAQVAALDTRMTSAEADVDALQAEVAKPPLNPARVALLAWYDVNRAPGSYPVGSRPRGVAFDGENIWVTNYVGDSVSKLRAADGSLVGAYPAGNGPEGIAFDGVNVWVTSLFDNAVRKLRASDGSLVGAYAVGQWPRGVAFDGANIWVTNYNGRSVSKLNAADGSLVGAYSVGGGPIGIVFDGASIWVANSSDYTVSKLRASDGSLVGTYAAGRNPHGIAYDGANIWVTSVPDYNVSKLRASDGSLVGTYSVGAQPIGVAFDGANIWVANSNSDTVSKLRAADGSLVGTYSVGSCPWGIAFDGVNIWVTNSLSYTVTKM